MRTAIIKTTRHDQNKIKLQQQMFTFKTECLFSMKLHNNKVKYRQIKLNKLMRLGNK